MPAMCKSTLFSVVAIAQFRVSFTKLGLVLEGVCPWANSFILDLLRAITFSFSILDVKVATSSHKNFDI